MVCALPLGDEFPEAAFKRLYIIRRTILRTPIVKVNALRGHVALRIMSHFGAENDQCRGDETGAADAG